MPPQREKVRQGERGKKQEQEGRQRVAEVCARALPFDDISAKLSPLLPLALLWWIAVPTRTESETDTELSSWINDEIIIIKMLLLSLSPRLVPLPCLVRPFFNQIRINYTVRPDRTDLCGLCALCLAPWPGAGFLAKLAMLTFIWHNSQSAATHKKQEVGQLCCSTLDHVDVRHPCTERKQQQPQRTATKAEKACLGRGEGGRERAGEQELICLLFHL